MKKQLIDCKEFFNSRGRLFNKIDWVSDKVFLHEIVTTIENQRPRTMLDLGIGTGVIEQHLSLNIDITGIDKSSTMCEISKNSLPEATILRGDIQNLSFLNGKKFYLIFSRATLGHTSIFPVLRQLQKYLEPSGKIVFCESISYSDADEVYQLKFHNLIHPGHVEFPTKNKFLTMFTRLGYKVKSKKMLYTRCDTASLFASLKTKAKVRAIYRYLENLSKNHMAKDWHIQVVKNNIFYRRPWLILIAQK